MLLKPKKLNLATGGPLVVLMNEKDTKKLELTALDRVNNQSPPSNEVKIYIPEIANIDSANIYFTSKDY